MSIIMPMLPIPSIYSTPRHCTSVAFIMILFLEIECKAFRSC